VRARDGAHEQDDREHHQAGRDDGRGEADLSLGVQEPTAGGDEHQHERPQQLREQPAVLELGLVEVIARTELERQPSFDPLRIVDCGRQRFPIIHVVQHPGQRMTGAADLLVITRIG
jgi:hypothetical protein